MQYDHAPGSASVCTLIFVGLDVGVHPAQSGYVGGLLRRLPVCFGAAMRTRYKRLEAVLWVSCVFDTASVVPFCSDQEGPSSVEKVRFSRTIPSPVISCCGLFRMFLRMPQQACPWSGPRSPSSSYLSNVLRSALVSSRTGCGVRILRSLGKRR
jgi:hypothetical protein